MLYSGGGWTNQDHVRVFVEASRAFVGHEKKYQHDAGGDDILLIERRENSAFGRWIDNFDDVRDMALLWAAHNTQIKSTVHVVDLAELSFTRQLQLAASMRVLLGAHGDGLTWGAFMGEGAAILEAVPGRALGFQACVEGVNQNPWGIFGGIARLAQQIHICWLNPHSEIRPVGSDDDADVWQWNWRKLNIHVDLEKLGFYLGEAAKHVACVGVVSNNSLVTLGILVDIAIWRDCGVKL